MTDLSLYLGKVAHITVIREDLKNTWHVHGLLKPGKDLCTAPMAMNMHHEETFGPVIEARLPLQEGGKGRYKVFIQVARQTQLFTTVFDIVV